MRYPEKLPELVYKIEDRGYKTPCWIWEGLLKWNGYGRFYLGHQKYIPAHVKFYNMHKGDIPEGLELDHLCRIRCCVNPEHLEPVNRKTNSRRGSKAILDLDKVQEIKQRLANGDHPRGISTAYGVSETCIWNIKAGRRWS